MKWIDASDTDRQQTVHIVAESKEIAESAVEKDYGKKLLFEELQKRFRLS